MLIARLECPECGNGPHWCFCKNDKHAMLAPSVTSSCKVPGFGIGDRIFGFSVNHHSVLVEALWFYYSKDKAMAYGTPLLLMLLEVDDVEVRLEHDQVCFPRTSIKDKVAL